MSLKCEYLVSRTGEPDDYKPCNAPAKYRVLVTQDEGEFSVCERHLDDLLPDATVTARLSKGYQWVSDPRGWPSE